MGLFGRTSRFYMKRCRSLGEWLICDADLDGAAVGGRFSRREARRAIRRLNRRYR